MRIFRKQRRFTFAYPYFSSYAAAVANTRNGTAIRMPEWDEALFRAGTIGDYSLFARPSHDELLIEVETQRAYWTNFAVYSLRLQWSGDSAQKSTRHTYSVPF